MKRIKEFIINFFHLQSLVAESMLIMAAIIHLGKSGLPTKVRPYICFESLCLAHKPFTNMSQTKIKWFRKKKYFGELLNHILLILII